MNFIKASGLSFNNTLLSVCGGGSILLRKSLHIYEFLKTKPNISAFVSELVEAYMKSPENHADLETKVEEIIRKLLQNPDKLNISMSNPPTSPNTLSADDKKLIDSLF